MALKDTWVDKKDGVDINSADDINEVAHAVIELENQVESGGGNGEDGFSPIVSVEKIEGGNRVVIIDTNGEKTFDVMDGTNGQDGQDGVDGKDGTSVTVESVTESAEDGGENVVTFSDGKTLIVKNGSKGRKGDPYTLTDTDKAVIVRTVIETLGGNPIFGIVDKDNNIILSGNLADGDYTVKYEMEDGSTVGIGNLVLDTNVYFSITSKLTNCTISNSEMEVIEGGNFSATISADSGYTLSSVIVTMGGTDISSTAVSGGVINIERVTGSIVITAIAEASAPAYTNQIPISINADGTPFVGTNGEKGYKTGYRLSLSGGGESVESGSEVTGFIPVTYNSVLRIKNIAYTGDTTRGIVGYDENFTKLTIANGANLSAIFETYGGTDEDNGVRRSEKLRSYRNFDSASLKYIRLCSTDINETSILTVDEPIV